MVAASAQRRQFRLKDREPPLLTRGMASPASESTAVARLHDLLRDAALSVPRGLPNPVVTDVSCDSRRLRPGTLFIGLPGTRVDGGSYWRSALQGGATAAVIGPAAASMDAPAPGDPVLVVADPVADVAGRLAAAFWSQPSQQLGLIGVTGTNGKTTTTHLIEHLANVCGWPTALFGTLANRWPGYSRTAVHTTPFADQLQADLAAAVAAGCRLGAMEVSSHALDQHRVAGCAFQGAVFTNLSQDHLDYHPSLEAYFEAKAKLFDAAMLKGRAVINIDDQHGRRLARRLEGRCWRASLDDSAVELFIDELSFSAAGVEGRLHSPNGMQVFRSPLVGRFNLMNLLQAVGVLLQQGLDLDALLAGLDGFHGVPGRMERVPAAADQPAVLVDYAHTPDGLENALGACRPFTSGKLICLFGCGGDRDRSKRPQMGAIAARLADQLVLTSDNPRTEDPQQILDDVVAGIPAGIGLEVIADRATAIATAIRSAGPGDLVLLAGKGHEDYQILGTTKVHFDDREQAALVLAQGR
jgi:UDP-N-acetylmuramoyl-L-alanyl-D-glutamate--2,6-diaminopimelate ligase